jgi:hypothetical protein
MQSAYFHYSRKELKIVQFGIFLIKRHKIYLIDHCSLHVIEQK